METCTPGSAGGPEKPTRSNPGRALRPDPTITRHADGGPTSALNGEGLGLGDHHTLDLPGWTVEAVNGDAAEGVRWTTPTGHTYTSKPTPILGHGNHRRRPPLIEVYAHPINAEYAVARRRSDE
jgi:hypothetical protein